MIDAPPGGIGVGRVDVRESGIVLKRIGLPCQFVGDDAV